MFAQVLCSLPQHVLNILSKLLCVNIEMTKLRARLEQHERYSSQHNENLQSKTYMSKVSAKKALMVLLLVHRKPLSSRADRAHIRPDRDKL